MKESIDYVVWLIPQSSENWTEVATIAIALLSFLVSVMALWVTIQQSRDNNIQKRKMVTPHLDGCTTLDEHANTYSFGITNNGIGPAIIKDVKFYLDEEHIPFFNPALHIVTTLQPGIESHHIGIETISSDIYISVGSTIAVIDVTCIPPHSPFGFYDEVKRRARIRIEYTSIYEDDLHIYDSNE